MVPGEAELFITVNLKNVNNPILVYLLFVKIGPVISQIVCVVYVF